MCSRGVFQLSKLTLYFCDYGGSSTGVRSFLMSPKVRQFMDSNPQIKINFICKRNNHPYITGSYINGYTKTVTIRSLKPEQIFDRLLGLRNQLGRRSFKASGTRVYGAVKSVQGNWRSNIFNKYPIAELQQTHKIPWAKIEQIERTIEHKGQLKQPDVVNQTLKLSPMTDGEYISNKGTQA